MLSIVITLAVILFDILSKYLTVQCLIPAGGEITVIPHILNFCYVSNHGAAFGILDDKRWVFMSLSSVLIVCLAYFIYRYKSKNLLFLISTAMILGGGIGNMIDRIFLGYVVDFIKVTFFDFPVFNIADSFVVIGTILLAIYLIFFDDNLSGKTNGK